MEPAGVSWHGFVVVIYIISIPNLYPPCLHSRVASNHTFTTLKVMLDVQCLAPWGSTPADYLTSLFGYDETPLKATRCRRRWSRTHSTEMNSSSTTTTNRNMQGCTAGKFQASRLVYNSQSSRPISDTQRLVFGCHFSAQLRSSSSDLFSS